ncbi:MAG: glycosyltransferase [Chitinophagales bacterium]|nr:hypothetical protein [Bacteroidota bacterium]
MENEPIETVHGLWIGGSLSALECLTIQSYLQHGFRFILWVYDANNLNVPENVVVKHAHEIIASEKVFQYKTQNVHGHGKGSYAGFSDIFRYKLLYEYGGIWTDMDITCLQNFHIQSDYFFRYHHKLGAVGNFMKCPRNSALMLWCYEQAVEQITADNKNWMLPIVILNEGIEKFNLSAHIHQLSNNDSFPEVMRLLSASIKIPNQWKLIHWMNEEFRRLEIDKNCVLNHSVLQQLYAQYHIKHTVFTGKDEWQQKIKLSRWYYLLRNIKSTLAWYVR